MKAKGPNSKVEVKVTIGHDQNGKAIRKSFYGRSKRDAKNKAEQFLIDQAINDVPVEQMTFDQLAKEYLKEKEKTIRYSTMLNYEHKIKSFSAYIGNVPISKITKKSISGYADMISQKYMQSGVKITITILRMIFGYAVDNGYISANPCKSVKYKSVKENKNKSVYSEEEAAKVLEYAYTRKEGLAVDIMLGYGTSVSETMGIQYGDIDFDNRIIHINRGVTQSGRDVVVDEPKNKHRKRAIAVSSRTIEHIRQFADPESLYVFSSKKKKDQCTNPGIFRKNYYNFMNEMHNHYLEQGIDIPVLNPHELRHTRASIWVNQDVNLFAIAEEMGWSDLSMLRKVYGHPDIDKLRGMLNID